MQRDRKTFEYMMSVIGAALGAEGSEPSGTQQLRHAASLAKKFRADALFLHGLRVSGMTSDSELVSKLELCRDRAVFDDAQRRYVYDLLQNVLAENGITFTPLKGMSVAELYPEPYMRTMSDIDIYINEDFDRQAVRKALEDAGFAVESFGGVHDIYTFEPSVTVEVHNMLFDITTTSEFCAELEKKISGHALGRAEEYVYLLTHFAKHVMFGGGGVMPLTDLYLYKKSMSASEYEKASELAAQTGLERFTATAEKAAEHLLSGAPSDENADILSDIVAGSGLYGSEEAYREYRIMSERGSSAGQKKRKSLLKTMFPPVTYMKNQFPVLQKHKIALPYFYILRAFRAVFKRKSAGHILKQYSAASAKALDEKTEILMKIGLLEEKGSC